MGALTITASEVAPVQIVEQFTAPTSTSTSKGDIVRLSTTNGKWKKAKATKVSERGYFAAIAIRSKETSGAVTAVVRGIIDVGDALSSLGYGARVYMSNSTGKISSTTGTVSTGCAVIGTVVPGWGYTTADKLLRVDISQANG